jgi:TusA-related sulfurtransferase
MSWKSLSRNCGISIQSARTAINHLKSTGEITIKSTNKFSIVTIANWEKYQCYEEDANKQTNNPINKPLTNDQQTTNNNGTKINKDKQRNNNMGAPSEPEFHINEGGDF